MKSLRERFEEEYAAVSVPADNKKGFKVVYKYYAPWYIWDLPEKELSLRKNILLFISVTSLMLYLATGLLDTGINRMVIPVVFSMFALCSHVLELFGVFQFRAAKYKTDRMTYQNVTRILCIAPLVRGCCMLMVIIAGIRGINVQNPDRFLVTAILGNFFCAVCAFYIFYAYRKIPFRTEKNSLILGEETLL